MIHCLQWPALKNWNPPTNLELFFQRAVYGKAHGAMSDFRWLAVSPNFQGRTHQVERLCALGAEDAPKTSYYWRPRGKQYYAVKVYPSQAMDASGRSGFLEKQFFEWIRPPEIPATAGAFILLQEAKQATDEVWWQEGTTAAWGNPDFTLVLADQYHPPQTFSLEDLQKSIARGIDALLTQLENPEQNLTQFYGQLLSEQFPIYMAGVLAPLPAEALAALLLPLPRWRAEQLSMAGWIPSQRLPSGGDYPWDLMVVPPGLSTISKKTFDSKILEQTHLYWRALQNQDPTVLTLNQVSERKPLFQGKKVIQKMAGTFKRVPIPSKTVPKKNEPPSILKRPLKKNFQHPDQTISITKLSNSPGNVSDPTLRVFYNFAKNMDKRWIAHNRKLPGNWPLLDPMDPQANTICEWVQEVREQCPSDTDKKKWEVKVDILRAMAILIVPSPKTLERVRLPITEKVGALHFLNNIPPRKRDIVVQHIGMETMVKLIKHSRSRNSEDTHTFKKDLEQWLQTWQKQTRQLEVRLALRTLRLPSRESLIPIR